jgi:uncharacterized protein
MRARLHGLLPMTMLAQLSGCATPQVANNDATAPTVVIATERGAEYEFVVELAVTEEEHQQGLMFRRELARDHGMLFIFAADSDRSFWMKNTLIPLDMVFIGSAQEVVGVVHDAEPLTLTPRTVGKPSRYVLEINGGVATSMGIDVGSTVRWKNFFPTASDQSGTK